MGLMPMWIAPNLITITGLALNVFTSFIFLYYCPTATEEVIYLIISCPDEIRLVHFRCLLGSRHAVPWASLFIKPWMPLMVNRQEERRVLMH